MKNILYIALFLSAVSSVYAVSNPYALPSNNEDKAKESNYGYMNLKNKKTKKNLAREKANNYTYVYLNTFNFITHAPELGVVYKSFDLSFSAFGSGEVGSNDYSSAYYDESDHDTYMITLNYRIYNFVSKNERHIFTPYLGIGFVSDKYSVTSSVNTENISDLYIYPSIGVDYTYKFSTHNALGVKLGYPSIGLAYKLIF